MAIWVMFLCFEIHPEPFAEVGAAGHGVFGDFAGRARHADAAFADDVGAIGDFQGFTDVVVGDQHADAVSLELGDGFLEVGHGDRVDARERFVEQKHPGTGDQRPADLGAAAFPARQRVRGALRHVRDPHFVEESIGAGFQCYGEMGGLISLVFHNIICLSENAVLGLFS